LLLHFFLIVNTYFSCEDIARENCGEFLAIFFCPAFAASRMQHISDLHSKFALGPHHVALVRMVDIQSTTAEIRRGKKNKKEKKKEEEERRRKKPQDENITILPYYDEFLQRAATLALQALY